MSANNVDMGEAIALRLKQRDSGNGKAPAAAAAPAEATPPVRTPSNGRKATKPAAAAAEPSDTGLAQILEAFQAQTAAIEEVKGMIEAQSKEIEAQKLAVKGTNRLLVISLALNLTLAEQVLQAGRDDVLGAAFSDQDDILKLLQKLGFNTEEEASEDEASGE